MTNMPELKLEFLDHVAIYVADIDAAAAWYLKSTGLKNGVNIPFSCFREKPELPCFPQI